MGTPEQDLMDEMRRQEFDDAFDEFIGGKADELLEGEYNPFSPDNICEGMSEMSDEDIKDIAKCLDRSSESDADLLLATMVDSLTTYWRKAAREEAIRRYRHGDYDSYD